MRRLIPNRVELSILTIMALLCTLVADYTGEHDVALAGASVPLFITAAIMGMRRNDRLTERRKQERAGKADACAAE
jgi:hypothetical protein